MSANWLYVPDKADDLLHQVISAEQNWHSLASKSEILQCLDQDVVALREFMSEEGRPLDNLYQVIDGIFDSLAYSGPGLQSLPQSSLNCISFCVLFRTGNPMPMAVVIRHLLRQLEFDAYIADVDQSLALVVRLSNSELIVMDVLTGASEYLISSDDVKQSLTNDIASFAKEIPHDELLKEILTEQKLSFLEEELYTQALSCVEALMDLLPEDPYERRDRGLVLQYLDCGQWAKDDLDYFLKACPNDPMAMFIKLQIEEVSGLEKTIH